MAASSKIQLLLTTSTVTSQHQTGFTFIFFPFIFQCFHFCSKKKMNKLYLHVSILYIAILKWLKFKDSAFSLKHSIQITSVSGR